ncbi:NfeD family protein [Oscillatoria sp. FACHB-1407]|nr:NfeD family protein [Oscillatoria sp. FACHB-1407]
MDYEGFGMQIMYWVGVSLSFIIWIRPVFVRRKHSMRLDAAEAETLNELQPGQMGRVLYEGSSWQARCENYDQAIAPHQKVYVLRREGNILIVAPEQLFHP